MIKIDMRRLISLILLILELCVLISCRPSQAGNCDQPVSDLKIAKIIEKIILEDTLTISQDLFNMYSEKRYLKKDRFGLPGTDVFINMKLERLRFGNDSLAFVTIRNLYPYLSYQDSIYIRCQINSDTTYKVIKSKMLSLKNLNEIDNTIFLTSSKEYRYKKYPAYYSFSKPYFFNDNKLCFVDIRWHCGALCGDFWLVLLTNRNGEWIILNRLHYGGL